MFRIEIHQRMLKIFAIFYQVGYWHRQEKETVKERMLKYFYSIYFFIYPISLLAGAAVNDNTDDKIFSAQVCLMTIVFLVKLLYVLWKKKDILKLLNETCDYYVDDRDAFISITDKTNILMEFATFLFSACFVCLIASSLVVPFVGPERKLFYQVWFPLDWRNDEYAFWMALLYVFTQLIIAIIGLVFSVVMWYLMAHCGWRYDVLGREMQKMGNTEVYEQAEEPRMSDSQKYTLYCRDLVRAVTSHSRLKKLADQLDSLLSDAFVVQLMTGGICICISIYCIAFVRGDSSGYTYLQFGIYCIILLFNIFDIFMIMFFGNEIKLASSRLSYCLYASNWIDRSQSIKRDILIFGEFLKQPHQLMLLKIYPLTLETFSRILHSAYSMFNLLKTFK